MSGHVLACAGTSGRTRAGPKKLLDNSRVCKICSAQGVGGSLHFMSVTSHPGLNRIVMFLAVLGVSGPGVVAIWMFTEAAVANHSRAAVILLVGCGLSSVLISLLVLGLVTLYLKASVDRSVIWFDKGSYDARYEVPAEHDPIHFHTN